MSRLPHLLFAALSVALPALAADAATGERATWIVSFAEQPVASYSGATGTTRTKALGLAATSPQVTGARHLDVDNRDVRTYRAWLGAQRSAHLAAAELALGRPLEVTQQFDVVNNAVAVQLSAAEAARFATLPGVLSVSRERIMHPSSDAGPAWIGADDIWNGTGGIATRGEGQVVGVIDTGVNRSHPSFAGRSPADGYQHSNPRGHGYGLCGGSGCTDKLIGVYDFTTCTGSNNQSGCDDRETNDGSDREGHGSHTASTAVGNPVDISLPFAGGAQTVRISGVAPRASLITYKACEEEENCRETWLLAALNQAVADGVDVINYSIGGSPTDPWSDNQARAMLAARAANVVVVVAAGNEGSAAGSVTSPGDAPWVLTAAASSHDRAIANRLTDLTGGDTPPPPDRMLLGASFTAGYGPVPIVIPDDYPGCSQGSELDSPPTGVSNPWPTGRFAGEIVVCERGTQARVAKSNNVRLAGGGGMVLTNQHGDGDVTIADQHSIPSTHFGYQDGQALRQWLASGSGHRARITAAEVVHDATLADRLAGFSSRGPVAAGDLLKPSVSAPGINILAAAGSGSDAVPMSGTSMAAPHVAGAAALLRAAHPDWTVADVETALMTTATPSVTTEGVAATAFEQGAGRLVLGDAVRIGLGLPVSTAEFDAAAPNRGGDVHTLNLPALVDSHCHEHCSFSRRVHDLVGGGRWTAHVEGAGPLAVSVTPSAFTLAAGASQTLQIAVDTTAADALGQWREARVVLQPDDASLAPTRLPVAVFGDPGNGLPATITVHGAGERGYQDVDLGNLPALADLHVSGSALARPEQRRAFLRQDETPADPYDSAVGAVTYLYPLPAGSAGQRFLFRAVSSATSGPDVALRVGFDYDGDGMASKTELLCQSDESAADETCQVAVDGSDAGGSLWVVLQNLQASSSGSDRVTLDTVLAAATPDDDDARLVATAPATLPRQASFPLRLAWDDPTLLPGDTRAGFVDLALGDNTPFARVPVTLTRDAGGAAAPRALVAGQSLTLALAAGQAQDRLFIDVPANASALTLTSTTAGSIDLYAAHGSDSAGPTIDAAPARSAAQASAVGGSGGKTLRVSGATLQPGRWYLTPVNSGSSTATVTLAVALEQATAAPTVSAGAYYNPARSGAGAFVYPAGDAWVLLWYSYLQDGTPTWYLGAAPAPTGSDGQWRVPLDRYVWNGSSARPTRVGEAILTFSGTDAFRFSFNLDGQTGSEAYQRIASGACPILGSGVLAANGVWFSPEQPGYGYNVLVGTGVESEAAYVYDDRGVARWLFGGVEPFGSAEIPMSAYFGACPLCSYVAPTIKPAGLLTRQYQRPEAGRIGLEFALPAPLSGSWSIDRDATRLSDQVPCR